MWVLVLGVVVVVVVCVLGSVVAFVEMQTFCIVVQWVECCGVGGVGGSVAVKCPETRLYTNTHIDRETRTYTHPHRESLSRVQLCTCVHNTYTHTHTDTDTVACKSGYRDTYRYIYKTAMEKCRGGREKWGEIEKGKWEDLHELLALPFSHSSSMHIISGTLVGAENEAAAVEGGAGRKSREQRRSRVNCWEPREMKKK